MDSFKLLKLAKAFEKEAQRLKGKSLAELRPQEKTVRIYRAVGKNISYFQDMDYVTLSKKFAIGHCDHMVAVEEEPFHVITTEVPTSCVFEAYNPGEYFYSGPLKKGYSIYINKGS